MKILPIIKYVAVLPVILLLAFSLSACYISEQEEVTLSERFSLSIDLDRTDFFVGETISFTVAVTYNGEQDISIQTLWHQPSVHFRPVGSSMPFVLPSTSVSVFFKANETKTITFELNPDEAGQYILGVYYIFGLPEDYYDNITIKLDDIIITVT